ncbi:MAG: AMP-binding protein, partial [Micromonosporaceae bacterium]|nr:AMP-binding protein [Micromonosporaceae bacterium]
MLNILFTSGSTGESKAVRVPQRGLTRLIVNRDWMPLGPGERFVRLGTLTFDVSTFEIFALLTSGATLVVPPPGLLSPADLADFFHAHQMWRRWN